jgi:hypothetical protein
MGWDRNDKNEWGKPPRRDREYGWIVPAGLAILGGVLTWWLSK